MSFLGDTLDSIKKKNIFYLSMSFIFLAAFFQNCGANHSVTSTSTSESLEGQAFVAGQEYQPELVPYKVSTAFNENLLAYKARTGLKAIVLNQSGEGLAQTVGGAQTQEEVNQVLLERCQLVFGNKPCAVFAEGNIIKFNEVDFYKNHKNAIAAIGVQFDANKIPGALKRAKDALALSYPNPNDTYNSLAIGRDGTIHRGWSAATQAEADRLALEMCESIRNLVCTLYASGLNVVFSLENFQWTPAAVHYYAPAAFDLSKIPFIDDLARRGGLSTANSQLMSGQHVVIALNRYGRWGVVASGNPISAADRTLAINRCNERIVYGPGTTFEYKCFVYSVDRSVVLTRDEFTMASFGY